MENEQTGLKYKEIEESDIPAEMKNIFYQIFDYMEYNNMNKMSNGKDIFFKAFDVWYEGTSMIENGDVIYPRDKDDTYENLYILSSCDLFHISKKKIVNPKVKRIDNLYMKYKKSKYQTFELKESD